MNIMKCSTLFLVVLFILSVSFTIHGSAKPIPLKIEYANTPDQRQWGLMGRQHMEDNAGMLFYFKTAKRPTFWAFGCYVDLAVLFLDRQGAISEIGILQAFPEIMDAGRPIYKLEDLSQYPPSDPIVQFFLKRRIQPKNAYFYVLEMSLQGFRKFNIKIGDTFNFANNTLYTH